MVEITVLKPFYDMSRKVDREPGDTFKATEERAAQIESRIPGYVTWDGKPEPEPQVVEFDDVNDYEPPVQPEEPVAEAVAEEPVDYSKLTNPQLKALCDERGITVKGRPSKAQLIELLEG